MRRILVSAVGLIMLGGVAQAEKADMSTLTCDEVTHAYLEDVVIVGAWLSGYYNGKRNNTIVDEHELAANTRKVLDFCQANPKTTVMNAVDELSKAH
jgi:hypothetical protein